MYAVCSSLQLPSNPNTLTIRGVVMRPRSPRFRCVMTRLTLHNKPLHFQTSVMNSGGSVSCIHQTRFLLWQAANYVCDLPEKWHQRKKSCRNHAVLRAQQHLDEILGLNGNASLFNKRGAMAGLRALFRATCHALQRERVQLISALLDRKQEESQVTYSIHVQYCNIHIPDCNSMYCPVTFTYST